MSNYVLQVSCGECGAGLGHEFLGDGPRGASRSSTYPRLPPPTLAYLHLPSPTPNYPRRLIYS